MLWGAKIKMQAAWASPRNSWRAPPIFIFQTSEISNAFNSIEIDNKNIGRGARYYSIVGIGIR